MYCNGEIFAVRPGVFVASVAAGVFEESLTALKLQTASYVTNVTSGVTLGNGLKY